MTYILILFVFTGSMSKYEANSLSMIEFSSEKTCQEALKKAESMASGMKNIKGECVKK